LKWSVQARNYIVKEGDLELKSVLRAGILASYFDPAYQEFSVSPNSTTETVLENLNIHEIPPEILKHGFLRLERRWVAGSLPTHELLDALAHCYSVLSLLLHDAWKILDSNAPEPELANGVLPCIIRSDEDRSIWVSLSTGAVEPIRTITQHKLDLLSDTEIMARYGEINIELPSPDYSIFKKTAYDLFQLARILLQKDGFHSFCIFPLLPDNRREMIQLLPENQGDKYRMMREVATRIARAGATGVIVISEMWSAKYDPAHPLRHASESPNRAEELRLYAISKEGEEFSLVAPFSRIEEKIVIQETVEQDIGDASFLEPIRRIWTK
jgi:hypothetical protein